MKPVPIPMKQWLAAMVSQFFSKYPIVSKAISSIQGR